MSPAAALLYYLALTVVMVWGIGMWLGRPYK